MTTVLVTGGAGYIGSVVTLELVARGHRVVVLDNLQEGNRRAVHASAVFREGSVGDQSALRTIFEDYAPSVVVHMAAETTIALSARAPEKYFLQNVIQPWTLLEAMREHDVRDIIFSSTAAVYGEPERTPITESHPTLPISPYGESKLMFERMLHWYQRAHAFRYVCFRYFNAAGAADATGEFHRHETHLIPILLRSALNVESRIAVEPVTIFGHDFPTADGTCVRDYVHVTDIALAHVLALEALPSLKARVFNLGTGTGCSVLELVNVARRITGVEIPAVFGPRRPGDPAVLVASADAARGELGWEPLHSGLGEIVATAWRWHRAHPRGYDH